MVSKLFSFWAIGAILFTASTASPSAPAKPAPLDPQVQAAFDAVVLGDNASLAHALTDGLDTQVRNVFNLTLMDTALLKDNLGAARLLLESGWDPNQVGFFGDNLLDYVTLHENLPLVKLLLAYGADYAREDEFGTTALNTAARLANPALLQAYVDAGADLASDRGIGGDTLLHQVMTYSDDIADNPDPLGTARLLLTNGLTVDARDDYGSTALHAACTVIPTAPRLLELVELLVASGADPNARNNYGKTPLMNCSEEGFRRLQQKLIELGGDINAQDNFGQTALHHSLLRTVHRQDVLHLLELRADPRMRDANLATPLHLALVHGDREIVTALLLAGAPQDLAALAGQGDLDSVQMLVEQDELRKSPALATLAVSMALQTEHADIAKYIIEEGAIPLLADCVLLDDLELMRSQLDSGADPNAAPDGRLPLCVAASRGNTDAIKLLAQSGADVDAIEYSTNPPLEAAIANDQVEAVRILLGLGANPNVQDGYGVPVIHLACQQGKLDIITALLDAGADLTTVGWNGWTPLLTALNEAEPSLALVKLLLLRGASVNAADSSGDTLWHDHLFYSCGNEDEIARALLSAGADLNISNQRGFTPLTWGAYRDDYPALDFLLRSGADPETPDTYGRTALLIASAAESSYTAQLLARAGATDQPAWLVEEAKKYGTFCRAETH